MMAVTQSKKGRSLKEMLTKPMVGRAEAGLPRSGMPSRQAAKEEGEGPVIPAFFEGLFTSLRDDLQSVKTDLSQDLKEVCQELMEVGERVATLEKHKTSWDEVIVQLQQELIRLKDQQIELQAHGQDL
ncbi:hypothetical protein NDU88_007136 [Pleurodeles waltl]|uniref:Uncharacterized protein n=1 Tax=Pleurodeles waltl TaxID=8319 RepID=A0AAV7PKR2_PLEWA|nr:hypothetical protein NDU88_007136 [Pleurodeles waltl]